MMQIRIARIAARSRANGPGQRFVVWTQGCTIRCPGCMNEEFWSPTGGVVWDTEDVISLYSASLPLRGITFSGGEPFEQALSVASIAQAIRDLGGDVVVFSGFTLGQIESGSFDGADELLRNIDLLVDGPWMGSQAIPDHSIGIAPNQRLLFFGDRIRSEELASIPNAEWIGREGCGQVTGRDMEQLRRILEDAGAKGP